MNRADRRTLITYLLFAVAWWIVAVAFDLSAFRGFALAFGVWQAANVAGRWGDFLRRHPEA